MNNEPRPSNNTNLLTKAKVLCAAGVLTVLSACSAEQPVPAGESVELVFGSTNGEKVFDTGIELASKLPGNLDNGEINKYGQIIHDVGRGNQNAAETGTIVGATPMSDGSISFELERDPNGDNG